MSEDRELLDGHVYVDVSGLTGTGKSAVMGEIEIALRALGVTVEHDADFQSEKNMTHADWQTALDLYKPTVVIRETNVSRARPPAIGVEAQLGAVNEPDSLPDRMAYWRDRCAMAEQVLAAIGVEAVAGTGTLAEREARVMQHWRWGNLTKLGVANFLRREGFRSEYAVEKANALAALPSVPVGGLGARPKAVVPTEGHDAAVVVWKCNCCQTRFPSDWPARVPNGFDEHGTGPSCPRCKAGGAYTYRFALHEGDPCIHCGVAHDAVSPGECPSSEGESIS